MEQGTEKLRSCKRCLTREMAEQGDFQSLRDYIENMDPDIRTAENIYEKRLAACKECDMLIQGICRKCGCYVELRASVAKNSCPWGKWQDDEYERNCL